MSIRRVILLGVVASLLFAPVTRAELVVRFTPETTSLFIYEPFALRLEVESDAPPEAPDLPAVPDLAVATVRRLPSDTASRKHAFRIVLVGERAGILTVPPFAVQADGEMVLTSPLRLRIRTPRPATEMELAISVEPAELRVGQPATVTVTWTSAVAFERCKQLVLEIPLLTAEHCRLFPLEPSVPEDERIGLPVNNVRLAAQASTLPDQRRSLSFRFALVPYEPCVLRAPPVRLVCALLEDAGTSGPSAGYFYNHFFEAAGESEAFERVFLTAPVPEITVRALTETGRTARFADIVGPCDLRVSVAPERLVVGQPALLTVELNHLTFARHITGLPSAAFDGLRSEFQLSAEPIREAATDDSRSFTYILRPLRPGIARIPAVVIQTFHSDSGEYQALRSPPIPITVEPNPEVASSTFVPAIDSQPPVQSHGIRHNRIREQTIVSFRDPLEFLGLYWWGFVPLPPLLWLALRPVIRRWERCRRDPVYARAMSAWSRFRRTVWRNEETAWRHYLADRLALCAEALTAASVTEALDARKVDADLVAETQRCFEEKDAADYGRRPAAPSQSTRSLVRRLHRATVPLVLVFSVLTPLRADAADGADKLFAEALQMREAKPDEAQTLFVEAALRFESAERYLNAGNSWFFAGENGRALANYRAAERRSPFDRQLRESIEFIRANRADAFPPPATPTGKLSASWTRFCTWMPVLRVGLFVLVYLIAWLVFLTAKLAGWRVRRAVWVVLLVAAFAPLVSVVQSSFQSTEGVVIEDTIARTGPGYAYDPAFEQTLHKATEFSWLETRQSWVRARLPDATEGWLRESDCMKAE